MSRKFYHTGRSPAALWQRLRIWIAYRRPVTYRSLRKIAHEAMYRDGNLRQPDPAAEAIFNAVVREAERPIWRK